MKEKTLGAYLRRGRAILAMTLRDVEEATGFSNAYLSQLENDKIKKPSANVLYKLSQLYKIELETLLYASGVIKEDPKKSNKMLTKLGELTPEEESQILIFLKFLRSK